MPEEEQDRHMAMLMKMQSKSGHEFQEERRLDILLKPALPGATATTFGGLKRQKALNSRVQIDQLVVRKRKAAEPTEKRSTREPKTEVHHNANDNDNSQFKQLNSNSSLALVCNYDSSSSSSETELVKDTLPGSHCVNNLNTKK